MDRCADIATGPPNLSAAVGPSQPMTGRCQLRELREFSLPKLRNSCSLPGLASHPNPPEYHLHHQRLPAAPLTLRPYCPTFYSTTGAHRRSFTCYKASNMSGYDRALSGKPVQSRIFKNLSLTDCAKQYSGMPADTDVRSYNVLTNIHSPDGHVFQVEYAGEAVKRGEPTAPPPSFTEEQSAS